MKKEKHYVYRIKDLQTGLYFGKEYWQFEVSRNPDIEKECQYKIDLSHKYGTSGTARYLKFNQKGRMYPTKLGAERHISKFNGNTIHDRKTQAARILNCKFSFVVVKTEVTYKDIKE